MLYLKQSTAVTLKLGPFVDETDGKTAETALTISQADVRVSKNGGDFAQKNETTSATHDEIGYYDIPLNTTDTGTLGTLLVAVHESGALPVYREYMVLPANVYDSLVSGSDYLQADTVQVGGTNQTARDIGASVLLSPGTGTGQVSLNSGAVSLHTTQPAVTFTSLTCTGTFTISDGIVVTCSTSNRTGILVTGNGTGHGVHFRSGSGATGEGFVCQALSTNGHGFAGYASGSFNGIYGYGGGGTGNGIKGQGGDTSGSGIYVTAVSGSAIYAASASGFGFQIVAGASNNSAIKLTPAGSGYGIEGTLQTAVAVSGAVGSVTGNVGGNVVGSVASVTGNVGGNVVGSVASVSGAVGSVTGNVGGNVTGSVGSVVGAVGSVTGNVGGNVTGSVGSVATGGIAAASFAAGAIDAAAIATGAIDADALATDAVTEIIDAVKAFEVETGVSFLQAMRAISAMLAGTVSGGGTGTEVFKGIGGSTTRVTATADSSGNRSAMTLNL